jgi:hypothetical protein
VDAHELELAVGATLTGVAAVLTAWAAVVKARGEAEARGEEQCEERLKAARTEAEAVADQLHTERMRRAEGA